MDKSIFPQRLNKDETAEQIASRCKIPASYNCYECAYLIGCMRGRMYHKTHIIKITTREE